MASSSSQIRGLPWVEGGVAATFTTALGCQVTREETSPPAELALFWRGRSHPALGLRRLLELWRWCGPLMVSWVPSIRPASSIVCPQPLPRVSRSTALASPGFKSAYGVSPITLSNRRCGVAP